MFIQIKKEGFLCATVTFMPTTMPASTFIQDAGTFASWIKPSWARPKPCPQPRLGGTCHTIFYGFVICCLGRLSGMWSDVVTRASSLSSNKNCLASPKGIRFFLRDLCDKDWIADYGYFILTKIINLLLKCKKFLGIGGWRPEAGKMGRLFHFNRRHLNSDDFL